jgi:chaperonin GroES
MINPLNDKIVVRRAEANSTSPGGIVLPEAAKEQPKEGTVLATGKGKVLDNGERATMEIKVDDRIIFSAYAGTEVTVEDETLLVMNEDDVLAVIT